MSDFKLLIFTDNLRFFLGILVDSKIKEDVYAQTMRINPSVQFTDEMT